MCYLPGSNDMPPPGTQKEGRKTDKGRVILNLGRLENLIIHFHILSVTLDLAMTNMQD